MSKSRLLIFAVALFLVLCDFSEKYKSYYYIGVYEFSHFFDQTDRCLPMNDKPSTASHLKLEIPNRNQFALVPLLIPLIQIIFT